MCFFTSTCTRANSVYHVCSERAGPGPAARRCTHRNPREDEAGRTRTGRGWRRLSSPCSQGWWRQSAGGFGCPLTILSPFFFHLWYLRGSGSTQGQSQGQFQGKLGVNSTLLSSNVSVCVTDETVRVEEPRVTSLHVGWAMTLSSGEDAATRRHMLWLPVVAALTPALCAYCYAQMEGTVVEARALREHMYQHKRA